MSLVISRTQHAVITDHAIVLVSGLYERGHEARVEALGQLDRIVECRVGDLPPELRSLPEWPKVPDRYGVLVFPKSIIEAVRVSWLRGLLARLKEAPTKTRVLAGTPFWMRGRLTSFLLATGYRVE